MNAAEFVLVPFGSEFLALTREQFEQARRAGQELMPSRIPAVTANMPTLLDADGMEAQTAIKATWWLEQARLALVPHVKAGKYIRFNLTEALGVLEKRGRPAPTTSGSPNRRHIPPTEAGRK